MSDEIKKYLETPDVPEKFRPENIHTLLESGKRRKIKLVTVTKLVGSVAACAVIAIGA